MKAERPGAPDATIATGAPPPGSLQHMVGRRWTILDYQLNDLLFAHWMKRKREMMAEHKQIPTWLDNELDKLRPLRNPHCSIFVLDSCPLYAA